MGEDQALEQLQNILARPEFQIDQARSWWDQLLAPVFDLLGYLLARLVQGIVDASAGREGWLGIVVLGLCMGLFVAVFVYLVRAIRLSVTRESRVGMASLA